MLKKLAKISTKLQKLSTLEAEWKAEGSSELTVSPTSMIMHIFDSQKPVSTDMTLCPTICRVQEERAVYVCQTICQVQGAVS